MVDVVDTQAVQLQRPGAGDPDGRRPVQFVALGDRGRVVRVGARMRVDPPILGDAEALGPLDLRQDQRGALIDHVVGVHQLGVRAS